MNEVVKTKWVEALRSGNYKQGHLSLRDDNNFCCLGVLCDLYLKEVKEEWKFEEGCYLVDNEGDVLPPRVIEWAGLGEYQDDPMTNEPYEDDDVYSLSSLNDNSNYNFQQISDIIMRDL